MLQPPFDQETIDLFNRYQASGVFHPYTCGNCSGVSLKINSEHLYCDECDYTQDKIHMLPKEDQLTSQEQIIKTFLIKGEIKDD